MIYTSKLQYKLQQRRKKSKKYGCTPNKRKYYCINILSIFATYYFRDHKRTSVYTMLDICYVIHNKCLNHKKIPKYTICIYEIVYDSCTYTHTRLLTTQHTPSNLINNLLHHVMS